MDRGSVFAGSAFRTAIHASVAVLVTLATISVAAFFLVQSTLESEIQRQVLSEQVMLRDIYHKGGKSALLRTISEINNPVALSRRALGVFGTDGIKLAGNIQEIPNFGGFKRANLTIDGTNSEPSAFYVNTTLIDEITLVIGHDLSLVTATERQLILTLVLAGLVAGAAILLIGYIASRKSLRKLEMLDMTLDRISQGETGILLPVSSENDQIDRISRRVNAHLERLSSLMISTKATAAAIAHDLKTPLSRAFLSLQIIRSKVGDDDEATEAIDDTENELTRLNAIFETILNISRIESTASKTAFRPVALFPLITDLAETFEPMAEERGQKLSARPPEEPVLPVLGDERMLRQMLVNLIQNAINYGPTGNAIALSLRDNAGHRILEVSDTGPGIPISERAKVFDPFYRLDISRTTSGSGLGLALVKAIAERHGISISLGDNDPGLKVTLTFPRFDRHDDI
ncbi:MAG: HAMP domain-containing sensor histidine kinase [Albidovulum sp.]